MGDNLSRADRAVFESLLHMEDPEQDFLASNGPVLRSRRRASSGPLPLVPSKRPRSSQSVPLDRVDALTSPTSSVAPVPLLTPATSDLSSVDGGLPTLNNGMPSLREGHALHSPISHPEAQPSMLPVSHSVPQPLCYTPKCDNLAITDQMSHETEQCSILTTASDPMDTMIIPAVAQNVHAETSPLVTTAWTLPPRRKSARIIAAKTSRQSGLGVAHALSSVNDGQLSTPRSNLRTRNTGGRASRGRSRAKAQPRKSAAAQVNGTINDEMTDQHALAVNTSPSHDQPTSILAVPHGADLTVTHIAHSDNGVNETGNVADLAIVPTQTETLADLRPRSGLSIPYAFALSLLPPPQEPIEISKDRLLALSASLQSPTHANEKPDPEGQPPVWADGRQALCETLPYYRAYQSAGYTSGGLAYAFYFDKEGHDRDYFDSNVIISRAGGGLSRDNTAECMVMLKDQTAGSQVTSLQRNIDEFYPVAIIMGNRNSKSPSKMPHPFCVLDWFKPTHIWHEKSQGKTIIRFRFEKLNSKTPSWWKPQGVEETVGLGELGPAIHAQCTICLKKSAQVFLQGWVCLEPTCSSFWKFSDGTQPNEQKLSYDPRFLKQRTWWPHETEPQSLVPDITQIAHGSSFGLDVSFAAWRGFVCPRCRRCSSRENWIGWMCKNERCNYTYSIPHQVIRAPALYNAQAPLTNGFSYSMLSYLPEIQKNLVLCFHYRVNRFVLPGIAGSIIHLSANRPIIEERGGPNDMWEELQAKEIGLKRRSLKNQKLQGEMLTQHFAVNYGMPYKYVAATESKSFEGACSAITSARSRLQWASRFVTGEEIDFNEVLALGYFEKQAISYHDDGERGLGPTIATLSLGYSAVMKLRMKSKHYQGGSNVILDLPPVPGCLKYEERLEAYNSVQKIKDPAKRKAQLKDLYGKLDLEKKGRNAPEAVTMRLNHGDIVVMHGEKIQEYYEHAVEPIGKLRFALTCRNIKRESLNEADLPAYEVGPDEAGYDGTAVTVG